MKEPMGMERGGRGLDGRGMHSPASEAFRILRTNLQFAAVDSELRVLLVTSCSACEGKSTIAQYLAQTISQTGKRVMIVDANLISPSLHRQFRIPNQQGLSNLIMGEADFTVFTRLEAYPNLCVITSGPVPPNSSELLGGLRMRHLMDRLREEYELIILDVPPVLSSTDAIVASSLADGVLLVVQAGHTRVADVRHACEALDVAHANLLGIVLNTARHRAAGTGVLSVRSRRRLQTMDPLETSTPT